MTLDFGVIVGFAAGIMTTAAFVPQVIKTWRTKSTGDLSLPMFLSFFCGVFLWLLHGLYIRSTPIIAANAITLVLAGSIIYFKLRYK